MVHAMEDTFLTAAFLPAAIAVIMFGLGTSLSVADFKRVVVFPRGIAIGIANLVLVAPLLAFGVAELFGLPPALAIGLVLLGASPGGAMANMLTHWARGDTALSVTMTAVSSMGAVITVPLYLGLASGHFGGGFGTEVSMPGIVAQVLAITAVPVSAGMVTRHLAPARIERSRTAISRITIGLFVAMVVGVLAVEGVTLLEHTAAIALACLTLNVAAMSVSYSVARAARVSSRQATAIAMELGIHNAALAIAVGGVISTELTVPAAVYAGFMFFTAGGFAAVMERRNRAAEARGAAATPEVGRAGSAAEPASGDGPPGTVAPAGAGATAYETDKDPSR